MYDQMGKLNYILYKLHFGNPQTMKIIKKAFSIAFGATSFL